MDAEIVWHLGNLAELGIEATGGDLPAEILLRIALSSVDAWSRLTESVPWLGRYCLVPGIAYRVFAGIASAKHGIVCHGDKLYNFSQMPRYPRLFVHSEHYNKGRLIQESNMIQRVSYSRFARHTTARLVVDFAAMTPGHVKKIILTSNFTYHCPVCNTRNALVEIWRQDVFDSEALCPNCYYLILFRERNTTGAKGHQYADLTEIGLPADGVPCTPAKALMQMHKESQRLMKPRIARVFPTADDRPPKKVRTRKD
jgi:DNA-directed RNA polymerase subunit RPC12/RpoP